MVSWETTSSFVCSPKATQVFFVVREDDGPPLMGGADDNGFVNRHGLSRKVSPRFRYGIDAPDADLSPSTSSRR